MGKRRPSPTHRFFWAKDKNIRMRIRKIDFMGHLYGPLGLWVSPFEFRERSNICTIISHRRQQDNPTNLIGDPFIRSPLCFALSFSACINATSSWKDKDAHVRGRIICVVLKTRRRRRTSETKPRARARKEVQRSSSSPFPRS